MEIKISEEMLIYEYLFSLHSTSLMYTFVDVDRKVEELLAGLHELIDRK